MRPTGATTSLEGGGGALVEVWMGRMAAAWITAVALLLAASMIELHLRISSGLLIAHASDYAIGLLRLAPLQAAWALPPLLPLALAGRRWHRLAALGWLPLGVVAAVDAAGRQFLGEAWLGALQDADLAPAVLPGLVYFGLLPTLASGLVLTVALLARRHHAVAAAGAAALLCLACVPVGHGVAAADGPNLLLVTIDTWRYDHLSAAPDAVDASLTPRIDALATRGTLFTEARAHAPITVPSHASMLSGRTPWEHGILTNGGKVDAELPWLPEQLSDEGWRTGAIISGAVIRGRRGFSRGFDRFHDDLREPPRVDDLVGLRLLGLLRGDEKVRVFRAEAPRAVQRASTFLERSPAGRPWFLWVHLYDVHQPHTAPEADLAPFLGHALDGLPDPCEYARHPSPLSGPGGLGSGLGPSRDREAERRCAWGEQLDRRLAGYRAEVVRADAAVGELVDLLERRGELDRTAVIVTADHGESLTEHGSRLSHQFTAYESVLRVPLVVVPPGGGLGIRSDALVQHRDLPATAAELLGLEDVTGGRSWLADDPGLNHVASVVHAPSLAMTRAMRNRGQESRPKRGSQVRVAVRDRLRSLVITPGLPDELYDLATDRHQVRDLVSGAGQAPPDELLAAAEVVVRATSRRDPEDLQPDDPDLEALRALGYVE